MARLSWRCARGGWLLALACVACACGQRVLDAPGVPVGPRARDDAGAVVGDGGLRDAGPAPSAMDAATPSAPNRPVGLSLTCPLPPCFELGPALNPEGHEVRQAALALDGEQHALIVYVTYSPADQTEHLVARRFDVATSEWRAPQALGLPVAPAERDPFDGLVVGFDSAGHALLVFAQRERARYHLWSQHYDVAGDTWSESIPAEDDPVSARPAQLLMQPSGSARLLWDRYDEIHSTRWWNGYDADAGTWGQPESLEGFVDGFPIMTMMADGGLLLSGRVELDAGAVWPESHHAVRSYQHSLGTFGPPTLLSEPDASLFRDMSLVASKSGHRLALWRELRPAQVAVVRRYDPDVGAWGAAQVLLDGGTWLEDPVALDLDDRGGSHVLWQQASDRDSLVDPEGIFYRAYDPQGRPRHGPVRLTEAWFSEPRLALSASGDAYVAWQEYVGDVIHVERVRAGGEAFELLAQSVGDRPRLLTFVLSRAGRIFLVAEHRGQLRVAVRAPD